MQLKSYMQFIQVLMKGLFNIKLKFIFSKKKCPKKVNGILVWTIVQGYKNWFFVFQNDEK